MGAKSACKTVGGRLQIIENSHARDADQSWEGVDLDVPAEVAGLHDSRDVRAGDTEACRLDRGGGGADLCKKELHHLLQGAVVGAPEFYKLDPRHPLVTTEEGDTEVGAPQIAGKDQGGVCHECGAGFRA